eukprot:TRINITY_DN481_c0_g1_i2.p1 TRINITY_DN481_c0_g1~~TRINITY_DN481_c0_g1_i2.p1  ORF type:complete len:73 (-),score=1.20 TRINITY_DN481_c0_g1_i2:149-367(-)
MISSGTLSMFKDIDIASKNEIVRHLWGYIEDEEMPSTETIYRRLDRLISRYPSKTHNGSYHVSLSDDVIIEV